MMIPDWVNTYIGIEFLDRGRNHSGLDCYGLARLVLSEQFGIHLPSYDKEYENTHEGRRLEELIKEESGAFWIIPIPEARAGDIVILRTLAMAGEERFPAATHLALVVASGWMVHADERMGVVCEDYRRPIWQNRIEEVRRHEDLVGRPETPEAPLPGGP